jgi:indole-3-glycerol phosphate synthase
MRIDQAKGLVHPGEMQELAHQMRNAVSPHVFQKSLMPVDQINIIAEYKRRSPSKGVIREHISPAEMARLYQSGGARAISVLTEEDHFSGSLEDFRAVRSAVEVPLLRKDFMIDEYQLYESAAAGASAVLLIAAALDDEQLMSYQRIAEDELRMDALIEVHNEIEMKRAVDAGAKLIGVNNRDLKTFDVSLDISARLADLAPAGALLVSESGLRTRDDLLHLREMGFSAFLIGESLMRSDHPDEALRQLIS